MPAGYCARQCERVTLPKSQSSLPNNVCEFRLTSFCRAGHPVAVTQGQGVELPGEANATCLQPLPWSKAVSLWP